MRKLREAAQAVVDIVTWRIEDVPPRLEFLMGMVKAVEVLRAALAEDRLADYMPPKRDEQAKGKEMTREEIVRLAREAGLIDPDLGECVTDFGDATDSIHRFAALVAAVEREACEKLVWATPEPDDVAISHREAIVKAIRARGQG